MARIEDIHRRLLNWARWRSCRGTGGLGYSGVDLTLANAGRDGYAEATVPILDIEAEETAQGLLSLPSELRATVELYYLGTGTMKDKAKRLCCAEATVYARIDQAHYQLQSWLSGKAHAQREQRDRVEKAQRAARP
jgi:DNA-directed RNA polymerase specialized sigma24 family protein